MGNMKQKLKVTSHIWTKRALCSRILGISCFGLRNNVSQNRKRSCSTENIFTFATVEAAVVTKYTMRS